MKAMPNFVGMSAKPRFLYLHMCTLLCQHVPACAHMLQPISALDSGKGWKWYMREVPGETVPAEHHACTMDQCTG